MAETEDIRRHTLQKNAQIRAREFSDVFESEAGKRVLEEIRTQFCGFTVTDNPHTTIVKAAQQDVVIWIEQLINRGKGYELEG